MLWPFREILSTFTPPNADSTTEKLFTFFLNSPVQNSKTFCFHEVQMFHFSFIEELHFDKAV